jgi:uncharacterized repeat protein (TIGR01451 family)
VLALAVISSALVVVSGGGSPARADATVVVSMNVGGGTQVGGRWLLSSDINGCTGPTFTFDISVSNAPVHQAAIEAELHGFAHVDRLFSLSGFAGGQTTVSSSYDWTGPVYGTHVVRAFPMSGASNTIPAGTNLPGRSFQLCPNPHAPLDTLGDVTFRFVGIDGDTGNPISIPIGTANTVVRNGTDEDVTVVRRGMTPLTYMGNPGYQLDFFVRFRPCTSPPNANNLFCTPYLGQLTETFTGPPGAVFLSWELRESDDSGPFAPPADWFPEPPTGDLTNPFAPDGTEPIDWAPFTTLSSGDPMPSSVTLDVNAWPTAVCAATTPPAAAGNPHTGGFWPGSLYGPAGGGATCGGWKNWGWRLSVWVPEPPPNVAHTYTLGHTHVTDRDWDGTFTPEGLGGSPQASYTVRSNPSIRASSNELEPKHGCTRGGDISGMGGSLGPGGGRCTPAEPNVNQGESALRFSWNGGVLVNPVVIDAIPPGFIHAGSSNGPVGGVFPGETPWTKYYHPGPCDLNTPRTDPGWVPATSWLLPVSAVRCVMWHTPSTAANNEYPDFRVNYQRDPSANPFTLPVALYPSIRGEESTNPSDCFVSPAAVGPYSPPVASQTLGVGSWQPLGTNPGGAGVLCVRWILPNEYHPEHPDAELVVTVFHVSPNGSPTVYEPGESAYGRNRFWVYADNMANARPFPINATLFWPGSGRDGTTWNGSWNQTLLVNGVSPTPPPPALGGTTTLDFTSSAWHHTGLGSPVVNWSILVQVPNNFLIDTSFDPGGPDGVSGLQVVTSPRAVLDGSSAHLPYTCTTLPDGDSVPGGGYLFCQATGTTADNGVQNASTTEGWRLRVRAYRMPGFVTGTWHVRAWNNLSPSWDGNVNPTTPLTASPFAPLNNDPTYGLVDMNGAPYYLRHYNYIAPSGRDYRAWAGHTMNTGGLRQFQVTKEFDDPANQVPPWPGGALDYRVRLRHQSLNNPDLVGAAVYDFLGVDPLSGSPIGAVVPQFVAVADDDPADDTDWQFSYWCNAVEDATPTIAEASGYTWEPTPSTGTCSGPAAVRGIRAIPVPVHDPVPGLYPVFQEQWDPGDVVDLTTLRQDGFVVSTLVPFDAQPDEVVSNAAGASAQTGLTSDISSGTHASTTNVDEIDAVDDHLGLHLPSTTLTSQTILANDSGGPSGLDPASVSVVAGPSGGTVTVNPDGTIDWDLPAAPGTYSFTYEVCNLNPYEPRCDTAVVTAVVYTTDGPAIGVVKLVNGDDANTPPGVIVSVGSTVTWTYRVSNLGNQAISDVSVVDDNGTPGDLLDDFLPGYVSGDLDSDGVLDPGETWVFEATGVAVEGLYTNLATATGDADGTAVSDEDPASYTGEDPTTTTTTTTLAPGDPVADLELDKQVDPATGPIGQTFTYTLVYRNLGPDPATNVEVTDLIPAGLTIQSASAGCTVTGQSVQCVDPGPVPANPTRDPGLDRAFEVVVQATVEGVLVNDAAVTAAEGDPEVSNNRDQVTVTVTSPGGSTTSAPPTTSLPPTTTPSGGGSTTTVTTVPGSTTDVSTTTTLAPPTTSVPTTVPGPADPDLALTKSVDVTSGPVGRTFTYLLVWTNLGPEPAEGVMVVDELPDGLVLVSADPSCSALGQVVTCVVEGVVAPGTSGSFTITARATRLGEFVNRAFVTSSTIDTNPANDVDTATVTTAMWRLPLTGARTVLWVWLASLLAAVGAALALAARRPLPR